MLKFVIDKTTLYSPRELIKYLKNLLIPKNKDKQRKFGSVSERGVSLDSQEA